MLLRRGDADKACLNKKKIRRKWLENLNSRVQKKPLIVFQFGDE